MTPREELEKLRRLRELQQKAASTSSDVTVTRIGDQEIVNQEDEEDAKKFPYSYASLTPQDWQKMARILTSMDLYPDGGLNARSFDQLPLEKRKKFFDALGPRKVQPELKEKQVAPKTDINQLSSLAGIVPLPADAAGPETPPPDKSFLDLALEPITSYPRVFSEKAREGVQVAREGMQRAITDPSLSGKAAGAGQALLGGVVSLFSPVEAAIETVVAEPVEKATLGAIPKEATQIATELALPFAPKSKAVQEGFKTLEGLIKIDPSYASSVKQAERAAEAQVRASTMGPRPTPESLKGGIAAKPVELYQNYIGRPALEFAKQNPLALATAGASGVYGLDRLDEDASVSDKFLQLGLWSLGGFAGAKATGALAKKIPLGDKNVAELFSRGVIDNYGLPQDYLDVKANAKMFKNQMSEDFLDLVRDVRKLSENDRKVLYYMMQGEQIPVENLANLSDEARRTITNYGQKMVDVGLLSKETFDKNAATYLHREYTSNLNPPSLIERGARKLQLIGSELRPRGVILDVGENEVNRFLSQGWERFGDASTPGKIRIRRQLTPEERKAKGEIDDAAFAIARTGQLMSNDIATYKLFDDISKMADFVSDVPREGWEQVTTDKLKGTNIARFGNLAGKYVDPTVLNDLKGIDAARNLSRSPAFKSYQQLLQAWKVGKTALNPVVHVNNIMSNFMLYDLSGSDWGSLARAANELRKGSDSELYEQARKLGVFDAGFAPQELGREGRKMLDEIESMNPATDTVDKMFRVANAGWKKTGGKVVDAYQQEDSIFRFGIFVDRMRAGMSPEDAAAEAKKWLIDYEINAPIIQAMRNSTHPFIAYSYRALPLLAESAAMRPWKYAKWATLGHLVNEYGEAEGAGDVEAERKLMPKYQQETWFGVPGAPPVTIKLPTKDRSEYIDVKRFIPGGDIFETTDPSKGRGIPFLPQMLQPGGPALDSFTIAMEGRDPFTGRDLPGLGLGNDGAVKGAAILKSLLPNLPGIPGSYATEKFKRAASESGGETATRSAITMSDAVLQSLGFKITPVDVEKLKTQQVFALQREQRLITSDFLRVQRRFEQGLADDKELAKAQETFQSRIEKVNEKYNRRLSQQSTIDRLESQKKAAGGPVRYTPAEEVLLRRYANGGGVDSERQRIEAEIKQHPWYSEFYKQHGEYPNLGPDADYDYITAWKAGIRPERDPYDQNRYHWSSKTDEGVMLKKPGHSTLWKTHFMDQTGQNPDALGIKTEQEGQVYIQRQRVKKASGGAVRYTPQEEMLLRKYANGGIALNPTMPSEEPEGDREESARRPKHSSTIFLEAAAKELPPAILESVRGYSDLAAKYLKWKFGAMPVEDQMAFAKALPEGLRQAAVSVMQVPEKVRTATPEQAGQFTAQILAGELTDPLRVGRAARAVTKPVMAELDVYHGSPHRYAPTENNPLGEFDASKIGTGEGAQAYGHGIYFAENPKVAKDYAKGVPYRDFEKKVSQVYDEFDSPEDAVIALKKAGLSDDQLRIVQALEKDDWLGFDYPHQALRAALKEPQNFDLSSETKTALQNMSSIYKADLPDAMIDRMLDWDKPLSQQAKSTKNSVYQYWKENNLPGSPDNLTGEQIHAYAMAVFRHKNSNKGYIPTPETRAAAADQLKNIGIPGIKYADAGSRGQGGSGTRNFVVFPGEEKKVKILKRD